MKKVIFLILIVVNYITFSQSDISITIPSNTTDMYLYKNLEEGEYQGVYVDLFSNILNNKEIDIKLDEENSDVVLRTIETQKGQEEYEYIDTPMIYRVGVVVNKNSMFSNLRNIKKLKVAYIPNQHGLKEFQERYKNLELEKIEVKNIDEGLEKLESGEVEAFITQDWYDKNSGEINYKLLENIRYNEQIAIKKGLQDIQEKIQNTLNNLEGEKIQEILSKNRVEFYRYLLKDTPSYETVREKYKNIKVKLGKDKFMLPFYYEQKNKYQGLTINISRELEEIIGIPFNFVKDGEYDIEGISIEDSKNNKNINYTKPYYEMKLSVANRKSDGFIQNISDLDKTRVLVLKDDYSYVYLKDVLKNSEIIEVESYEEGLEKLLNQKGDYLVGYFNILTGVISNNFLDDKIKVAGILDDSFGVSFGISKEKRELSNLIETILESFTVDKTIIDNNLLKNSIVTQNYKLIVKISIPVIAFIIILIILIIKSEKNRKKAEELSFSLIEVLEMANQLNDEDTGDHVKRLGMYSTLLSEKANLSNDTKEDIKRFSSLHDIGKVAIPSEILKKPSKLTEEEFKKVKEHVNIGYDLVKKLKLGSVAENIVRYHHEKWDGTGYPSGLEKDDIPLEARIVAIVDVYDALRQKKFHRDALTHEDALKVIKAEKGKSFDPELVDIFVNNDKEFEKIYEENKESLDLATEFYSAIKNNK
ncbi:transporter substrate-binding domain-containing protein [Cetobacterium somerae]|uniref:HD domain-containing phosphohydrolase n=1 Tax=Cetobacterium sp. NK01 TaxID=2993530 RepID=UPI002115D55D|nr:HD domain-containing phosphohydrolase [Cetobacterium sp. NK01]MCQ8212448.1 transporter substrate-binding domain-containing protein [Cetobacterium sp. NK01]